MNEQLIPVSGNQKIAFQCQRCSACCRHVENKVMLEPYDVYLLALHFQNEGQTVRPEDVCAQYAHPMPLEPYFPIFLLNTAGEDQHCIFLNGNHCSIYAHRPRACRLYPFTVDAGRRGKDFEYFLCTDYPGHFGKGRIRVSDWFYENFPKDARYFVKAEYAAIGQLGKLLRQMTPKQVEHSLFQLLFYRYWNYDLNKPFQEQFEHNQRQLLAFLQEQLTKMEVIHESIQNHRCNSPALGRLHIHSFEALDNTAAASDSAVPHGRRLRLLVHRVKNRKILHPGASCSAGCDFRNHDRLSGSDPG